MVENKLFQSVIDSPEKIELVDGQKGLVVGNRIPREFYTVNGIGESDITIHAGSYHLALKQAGIERANIMTYSSIMPAIATEIQNPYQIKHGEVMEVIMAAAHGNKGENVSAGIIYGWLYDKQNKKHGGLVCEHNGNYTVPEIESLLKLSLDELYYNGFSDEYDIRDIKLMTKSFVPTKKHGTALVAICFTNFFIPIL
ncbi:MAG: arginine decarboxylase [Bacteroidales bacterium]|nr:arginine decarboxylase [Bacteroidales bacterium]